MWMLGSGRAFPSIRSIQAYLPIPRRRIHTSARRHFAQRPPLARASCVSLRTSLLCRPLTAAGVRSLGLPTFWLVGGSAVSPVTVGRRIQALSRRVEEQTPCRRIGGRRCSVWACCPPLRCCCCSADARRGCCSSTNAVCTSSWVESQGESMDQADRLRRRGRGGLSVMRPCHPSTSCPRLFRSSTPGCEGYFAREGQPLDPLQLFGPGLS